MRYFFYIQIVTANITAQKMKFCIKDFFSKCDQIHRNLRIWSHLLKNSLMENFTFSAVHIFIFAENGNVCMMLWYQ